MLPRGGPERAVRLLLVTAVLVVVGCGREGIVTSLPPEIVTSYASVDEQNVLSIIVSVEVDDADSVIVRYGASGDSLSDPTPAYVPDGVAPVVIPVLGLHPDTPHAIRVIAFGGGMAVERDLPSIVTGSLPTDLPAYQAGG